MSRNPCSRFSRCYRGAVSRCYRVGHPPGLPPFRHRVLCHALRGRGTVVALKALLWLFKYALFDVFCVHADFITCLFASFITCSSCTITVTKSRCLSHPLSNESSPLCIICCCKPQQPVLSNCCAITPDLLYSLSGLYNCCAITQINCCNPHKLPNCCASMRHHPSALHVRRPAAKALLACGPCTPPPAAAHPSPPPPAALQCGHTPRAAQRSADQPINPGQLHPPAPSCIRQANQGPADQPLKPWAAVHPAAAAQPIRGQQGNQNDGGQSAPTSSPQGRVGAPSP